jgi:hypothetical protein
MKHTMWLAAALVVVVQAAGNAGEQQSKLSSQQRKDLEVLKGSFEAVPAYPESADDQLPKVRENFTKLLGAANQATEKPTRTLARTLVSGVNTGAISVGQSTALAQKLAEVLSLPRIGYQDVRAFTAAIDPLVQGTDLDGIQKMALYRQALVIVKCAPGYSPDSR